MDFDTTPAISTSTDARARTRSPHTRYLVATGEPELTTAQLWVRALAGDVLARNALLARIMPRPRN